MNSQELEEIFDKVESTLCNMAEELEKTLNLDEDKNKAVPLRGMLYFITQLKDEVMPESSQRTNQRKSYEKLLNNYLNNRKASAANVSALEDIIDICQSWQLELSATQENIDKSTKKYDKIYNTLALLIAIAILISIIVVAVSPSFPVAITLASLIASLIPVVLLKISNDKADEFGAHIYFTSKAIKGVLEDNKADENSMNQHNLANLREQMHASNDPVILNFQTVHNLFKAKRDQILDSVNDAVENELSGRPII